MENSKIKMLVTCAFPYANGTLHLGHILEQVQADIWVRYYRMRKHQVTFICSDDSHGTAIVLHAKKLGIHPKKLISLMKIKHQKILSKFSISHDYYSTTDSAQNKYLCRDIYQTLKEKKLIFKKMIPQLYDVSMKMFLSDRLVKGICPICSKNNQYGDHCEFCGSTYNAIQLKYPKSILSNTQPIIKSSKHLFLKLSHFSNFLKNWINSGSLQLPVLNKIKEWLIIGLHDWNISRDKPYFGFKVPGIIDKYFYVWWDAPIGYISCIKELSLLHKRFSVDCFWKKNSNVLIYHFIGKDIIYFHSLFWPAILEGAGYRQPNKIFAHGYLTINGNKLSKSKGIMISANQWLNFFDSDSLRYYFASKLSDSIDDIEMNLNDYLFKINSDLVNNIINLASRSASFLKKYFSNTLSDVIIKPKLYLLYYNSIQEIEFFFEKRQFQKIIKKIQMLSDIANQYITKEKPWLLIKNFNTKKRCIIYVLWVLISLEF
ncbi:methionyl-tRNA synthetase [Buchnera aphidicola (Cinara tujafilina)]|uniref:Methionine--tRNA ligase n=1 Tax=Buchnera aphidicola (Cinara tujafilina) TaxID=261317 RepID=F7WZ15_9GAMM|nr:methionine--tRNA ligase [Buchnera aphidicola]AEH39665.1 methionyl-tRNA synthetase [Buchnera aphidicola (Cinara tujafilina)]